MPDPTLYFTTAVLTPLVTETALARCTVTAWDPNADEWRVDRRWPSLSTGEEILWDILARLARRDPVPTEVLDRAKAHLDDDNRRVLVDVLLSVGEPV